MFNFYSAKKLYIKFYVLIFKNRIFCQVCQLVQTEHKLI